jgi:hypothetical protein
VFSVIYGESDPSTRRFQASILARLSGPYNHERLLMKRFSYFSLTILMTLCMIVGSERRAWGYVDPGSGLIALQTIASVAAAYIYMVRRRIQAFFKRKTQESSAVLPAATKPGDSSEAA